MTTILIVMFSLPITLCFSLGYLLYVGKLKTGVPRADKGLAEQPMFFKVLGVGNVLFGFYMIYLCAEFIKAFDQVAAG